MKKLSFTLVFILIIISSLFSQQLTFQVHNPPIPIGINNTDWSNGDFIVSSSQPFGRPSGIYRTSNNSIYVAIPDTAIVSGKCLVILRSSNNGTSWSVLASYAGTATDIRKTKIVNAGNDSLYLFYLIGTTVSVYNFVSGNAYQFLAYTNIRDFDAAASSQHALHLIIDLNNNNDIRQYASTNGGATWPVSQYISSTGATPRIAFSGSGDTCNLSYYASLTADTGSSRIRNFKFRESTPGTLASLGYVDAVPQGTFKDQFQPALYRGKSWLFYTTGTTGSIDLNCIQSNDNGSSFGAPFTIGALTGRDEYWFDAKYFTYGSGGIDLIYYSDSVASPTSNVTDRLYYTYLNHGTPTTYGTPVQISQHWPFWSSRMYIPSLIEFYNASGDAGVIWVGGPAPFKLYYDAGSLTTRINNNQSEIPGDYSLGQNYPNPFNPATKIDFSIPKNGMVTLKIYNIVGKEVATVIDKEMSAGSYSVDFNASKLSSGIYFYKLTSGSFTETRKMVLVK